MTFSEDCTTGTCILAEDDSSLTGGSFNAGTGITQQINGTGNVITITRTVTPTSGNNRVVFCAYSCMARNAGYTNTVELRNAAETILASHAIAGGARVSTVGIMHTESNVSIVGVDFHHHATGGLAIQSDFNFQVIQI